MTLVMVATIFNLLAGMNLVHLFPSLDWLNTNIAIIIVAAVVWIHVFVKTLGEVAWVSALNFGVTMILEVTVIVEALRNPPSEPPQWSIIEKNPMAFGAAFASFAFAYGMHPVLPTVYRSMRSPKQFECMNMVVFAIVICIYLPMMFVGYMVYGNAVKSPIYETPALTTSVVVNMSIALLTVHVMAAYAIVLNAPERELENSLGIDETRSPVLWRMCLRTAFVVIIATMAICCKDPFQFFSTLFLRSQILQLSMSSHVSST
jgi:vesicular inhibitory amino acid transporter